MKKKTVKKYNWEFAERGKISVTFAHGISGFSFPDTYGEYETFIDSKSLMKKHIIKINSNRFQEDIKKDGVPYTNVGPFEGVVGTTRMVSTINSKFNEKLVKDKMIIIDKDWFGEK